MIKCEGFCSVDVLWGMTSGRRFFVSLSFRGQRREEERTKKVGCFSIGNWQPNCLAYLPLYGDDDDNFYDYDNDHRCSLPSPLQKGSKDWEVLIRLIHKWNHAIYQNLKS